MTSSYSIPRLTVLAVLLLWGILCPVVNAQPIEQDTLEVALAIQLLSFTEWPSRDGEPKEEVIVIGVLEDQSLLEEFRTLFEEELYRGRFAARLIAVDEDQETFDKVHVVFFSGWNESGVAETIRRVGVRPVVLMGSFDGFLEMGGMVNFVKRQKRLRFEINIGRARERGIEFRAKLLRLAERVIDR